MKNKSKKNIYTTGDIINIIVNIIFLIPSFCYKREKKKNELSKSGYIINPPLEYYFHPNKYSKLKSGGYINVYERYGNTYYLDELI